MQPPERLVGAVEGVLRAVLRQRGCLVHGRAVVRVGLADRVVADGAPVADHGGALGVDVVAERDDEVEVVAGQQRVGVVVAVREVRAGEEAEAHGRPRVGRQRRLEAPDRAVAVARLEAVVVPPMRLEAGHPRLDGVAGRGRGEDVAACDHPPEVGVARHLEPYAPGAAGLVHDGQQRDRARRRIAGQHALGEAAAAEHVLRPALLALRGERVLRGEHGNCRDGARAREELPSRVHYRHQNTVYARTLRLTLE